MAGPGSGKTPFAQIQAMLATEVKKRFPKAVPVREYGIDGWQIARQKRVEWTHGTVDPNYVLVGVADRKQGPVLHLWNPLDWKGLGKHRTQLEAAGFKVMVGCLQFNRQKPYPMAAVAAVLDAVQADLASDSGQVPPYRTPRPKKQAKAPAKRGVGRTTAPAKRGARREKTGLEKTRPKKTGAGKTRVKP